MDSRKEINQEQTFLWYDYETFSKDKYHSRIASVAMVRTTLDFKLIGKPLVKYCKLGLDFLPSPEACLVNGLTPQFVNDNGIPEAELIDFVVQEFSKKGTIVVGYNSIKFDDEVTRVTLHRNLFNPFSDWQKNRWDVINLVRAVRDFKPGTLVLEKINPITGSTSFKLSDVAAQNNIEQTIAHNSLFDVLATIGIVKLIKEKQPKLFDWFFSHRTATEESKLFAENPRQQILFYTCSKPINNSFTTHPILPLFYERSNHDRMNKVLAFDLACDIPQITKEWKKEELIEINLKSCPFITRGKAEDSFWSRMGLSEHNCEEKKKYIVDNNLFLNKDECCIKYEKASSDPDIDIYGGFASSNTIQKMEDIHDMKPCERLKNRTPFCDKDARYNDVLFHHVARNYPEVLSESEREEWYNHCRRKITGQYDVTPAKEPLYLESYFAEIDKLKEEIKDDFEKECVLDNLYSYGEYIMRTLGL